MFTFQSEPVSEVDRGVAGDLAAVLPGVLRGRQGDQQGGGGGGAEDGEPLVVQHDEGPRGNVAAGPVVLPPPGEHHGAQSVHLALQPGGVARSDSVHLGGRQEDRQEGGVALLLVVLALLLRLTLGDNSSKIRGPLEVRSLYC